MREVCSLWSTNSWHVVTGTVTVNHSGAEMGQGINTRMAQVAAFNFDIPLEAVEVCTGLIVARRVYPYDKSNLRPNAAGAGD